MPLVAMRHAYVVTERIEGIQNMPNMRDHDASVYLKLQGDALCVGGYEPNPIFIDQVFLSSVDLHRASFVSHLTARSRVCCLGTASESVGSNVCLRLRLTSGCGCLTFGTPGLVMVCLYNEQLSSFDRGPSKVQAFPPVRPIGFRRSAKETFFQGENQLSGFGTQQARAPGGIVGGENEIPEN